MYDAKSEANEFVGEDRGDAVAKACRFFGVEEGDLTITTPGAGDIMGVGGRTVVVAIPKGATPPTGGGDSGGRRERSDRGDRGGRGRDRGDRGERGGRERGRDRDRSRSRSETEPETEPEEMKSEEVESSMRAERQPVGESRGTAEGKLGETGEFIKGAVEKMGLGSFRIAESAEGDFTVYELRGEAALALGSGDGRAVEAVQLLANQAAMRQSDDAPRIVVDAEGDTDRRGEFLNRLADRASRRAEETKRSVALDPMNARDRRALHMAVREMGVCATMSIGTGRYRQVVVVPEGSPDYDEALKSAPKDGDGE